MLQGTLKTIFFFFFFDGHTFPEAIKNINLLQTILPKPNYSLGLMQILMCKRQRVCANDFENIEEQRIG